MRSLCFICVLFIFFSVTLGAEIRCKLCPVLQFDDKAVMHQKTCEWSEKRITFQCRDGYSYKSGSNELECGFVFPWWRWTGTALTCIPTETTTTRTIPGTDVIISTKSLTTMLSTDSPYYNHSIVVTSPIPQSTYSLSSHRTTSAVDRMSRTTMTTSRSTSISSTYQDVQYTMSTIESSTNDFKTTSTSSCSEEMLTSKLETLNVVLDQSSSKPNTNFKTNDRVRYKCAKGYRFVNGTLEHICGNDGFWKGDLPYCKRCKCPCSQMKNQVIIKTKEELQHKIETMTKQLKVKKSDLASEKSRKISATDPRPSSKAIGSVLGVGILVFIVAVIVISDLPVLYRHIKYGPYA